MASWIRGDAELHAPARPGATAEIRPLELLDRLAPEDRVITPQRSEVTLVFPDGQRWVVEADSQAVVEDAGLRIERGTVRRLEPVPAIARLPRLARSEDLGARPGAARIRQGRPTRHDRFELYPRDGAAVPSDQATLRFTAVEGAGEYRVEVVDAAGEPVFAAATAATEVRIPPALLAPGSLFYWRVEPAQRDRSRPFGRGLFVTLSEDGHRLRAELAEQAARGEEPDLHLLRAEVDHRLGLRREACARVDELAVRAAANRHLRGLVERFDCAGLIR